MYGIVILIFAKTEMYIKVNTWSQYTVMTLTWREGWERLSNGNKFYKIVIFPSSCLFFFLSPLNTYVFFRVSPSIFVKITARSIEKKQIVKLATRESDPFAFDSVSVIS